MIEWRELDHKESAAQSSLPWVWMEEPRQPQHYALLAVAVDATTVSIRRAYRKRIAQLHPDLRPAAEAERAQQEASRLNEAYSVLRDPTLRAAYDKQHGIG